MVFVDSSVLVAAIAPEVDGRQYAHRIEAAHGAVTSPIVMYETVLGLARIRQIPVADCLLMVDDFRQRAGIEMRAIGSDAHILAIGAHARYGKGTSSPAQLNMGDCFSYALAKQSASKLLYKGSDFAHTDLA
jgi:ribonuclease VapC